VKQFATPQQQQMAAEVLAARNRRARRAKKAKAPKSGQGEHWLRTLQKRKELERTMRAQLEKIPMASLIKECPEIRLVAADYPNVWALITAELADLMKIKGVGPKKLAKIRYYLTSKNVPTMWRES
jgi:ERCC4-type nuclease